MKRKVSSPFRMVLPLAVALSLFTSLLTSAPSASADGAAGPSSSSGTGSVSTYTVIYNGNGNTSGAAPIDSTAYISGSTVNVASQGKLAKGGYTFGGWGIGGSAGPSTTYQPGQTFSILSDTTLTAVWTLIPTYTITYDGNGNTGGTAPSSTVGSGLVTLPGNTGGFVKNGSAFTGWNTASDGSGTSYTAGSTYNLNADITLHVTWLQTAKPYTIIYLGNTNTGGSAPGPTIGSGSVPLANNTGALVKTGFVFGGWNTQANGLGTPMAIASSYILTANLTLYAKWIRVIGNRRYKITYLGNTNTGGSSPSPTIGFSGATVHLANNTGALVKTGFVFGGWATHANGFGPSYSVGSPRILTANLTLYAKWVRRIAKPYTITYLGNTNSGGNAPNPYVGLGSVTLANRGNLVRVEAPLSTFYFGPMIWHFDGWNTLANGLGTSYAAGSTYNLSANITLYAVWGMWFTINYLGNGNTGGTVPTPTVFNTMSYSWIGVVLPANSGVLTKSGFSFGGWNTQADGLGTSYAVGSDYILSGADSVITIYAKWTAISCALGGSCAIGDIGPGGGTVFYSSQTAFTSVGSTCNTACHYLEAAPNTWSGGSADPLKAWAVTAYNVTSLSGTSSAIGSGLANSNLIVAQGNNATTAAGAARAYAGGNQHDWYLPSKNELNEMNLHHGTIGGFTLYLYWSSTQYLANRAWSVFIGTFNYSDAIKSDGSYVRPIRAF